MKQSGFYKLSPKYANLVKQIGGLYRDDKERPVYCCIQDKDYPKIYWAIPTSSISIRPFEQLNRIKKLCTLPDRDIRSCYYHIGHTNRPAIFKISNVLPVTNDCIDGEYTSQGKHLVLRDKRLIAEITRKLSRILFDESRHPDKYEQRISSTCAFLKGEMRDKIMHQYLGKTVTVTIDRPIGSSHPKYSDMVYPVNYGYIEGIISADCEEQDVYVLGVNEPLKFFTGKVIAAIRRENDVEDKWVVAPNESRLTRNEISESVKFQEQYFVSRIAQFLPADDGGLCP